MNRLIVFLFALLIPFLLSGCMDKREIEQNAYVIAMGLDKSTDNNIRVTYLLANPEYGSEAQGGGGNVPPREIITMETTNFITMKNRANAIIAKTITYDQLQVIAVSEKLARDKELIMWMYDSTKDVQIRRDVDFIVTKENADVFFKKTHPRLEQRVHKYFNNMIENGSQTGLIPPNSQLLEYFRISEAGSDLFLAPYATTERTHRMGSEFSIEAGEISYSGETNNTQFAGAAVFKNGRMIGTFTGQEVRGSIILNNTLTAANMLTAFKDPFNPKLHIALKINKLVPNKVRMNLSADKPIVEVTLRLTAEVLSDHAMVDYSKNKNREKLEQSVKESINERINSLIRKTQTEFKAQPFGFSLEARKKFLKLKDYQNYDFTGRYPDMDIRVKIELKVTDYGRQKNIPAPKEVNQH